MFTCGANHATYAETCNLQNLSARAEWCLQVHMSGCLIASHCRTLSIPCMDAGSPQACMAHHA